MSYNLIGEYCIGGGMMERYVCLDSLPRKRGRGSNCNKEVIDWKNSVGCYVDFNYKNIKGKIKICDLDGEFLIIKYKNFEMYRIGFRDFKRGSLGRYLNVYTKEFKIEIGTKFVDENRNIIIIEREIRTKKIEKYDKVRKKVRTTQENKKYYKYHCNVDGYEKWIREEHLLNGVGCAVCSGRDVMPGINDISTTAPHLIKFLVNSSDAIKYSNKSHKSIMCKCLDCNYKKSMRVADLYIRGFSCPRCSDGFSYPEKFVASILTQLNIEYIAQFNKKNFEWIENYRYDFYLPKYKIIIEVHGLQHYQECGFSISYEEQVVIDKRKKELALNNGICKENYIEIDARKSERQWIKEHIEKSNLKKIVEFENIDWNLCEEFANKSFVKIACEYKKNNDSCTTQDIAILLNIDKSSIVDYLKVGAKLGWCSYDCKEEMRRSASRNRIKKGVILYDENGVIVGEFSSMTELSNKSIELVGFKMHLSEISARCNVNSSCFRKGYNGFFIENKKSNE